MLWLSPLIPCYSVIVFGSQVDAIYFEQFMNQCLTKKYTSCYMDLKLILTSIQEYYPHLRVEETKNYASCKLRGGLHPTFCAHTSHGYISKHHMRTLDL